VPPIRVSDRKSKRTSNDHINTEPLHAAGKASSMAGSVNKVILIGNLGADPEVRRTQDGRPIVNLRLATTESWRDKNSGDRKSKTEWHNVVIFNEGLCKVVEQYVKKGTTVYVEGALQTRKWTDQQGQDRYSTEIVLQGFNSTLTILSGRGDGAQGGNASGGGNENDDHNQRYVDDDVPF
jgi:single-strand DNA-binding protein